MRPSPRPVAGGCAGSPDAQFPPPGTMTPTGTQSPLADQTYAVPLIQPDLRREEAIQQVADALQHLQKVSGDIFSRWVLLPPSPDRGLLPALGSHLSNPRMHPLRAPLLVILGPEGDPAGFLVPKGPSWVPSFKFYHKSSLPPVPLSPWVPCASTQWWYSSPSSCSSPPLGGPVPSLIPEVSEYSPNTSCVQDSVLLSLVPATTKAASLPSQRIYSSSRDRL